LKFSCKTIKAFSTEPSTLRNYTQTQHLLRIVSSLRPHHAPNSWWIEQTGTAIITIAFHLFAVQGDIQSRIMEVEKIVSRYCYLLQPLDWWPGHHPLSYYILGTFRIHHARLLWLCPQHFREDTARKFVWVYSSTNLRLFTTRGRHNAQKRKYKIKLTRTIERKSL